ncbi:MAG: organic solvent tolerance protein OstA [Pirellulales bacterium]
MARIRTSTSKDASRPSWSIWLAVRAVVNLSKLSSRTSLSFYGFVGLFIGMLSVQTSAGDVEFPIPSPAARISVTADEGSRSIQGSYTVYQLKGHCRIRQGSLEARAQEAVLWVEEAIANQQDIPNKAIIFLDGGASIEWSAGQRIETRQWMGRLYSFLPVDVTPLRWSENTAPPRALEWVPQDNRVALAQFQSPNSSTSRLESPSNPTLNLLPPADAPGKTRETFALPEEQRFGGMVLDEQGRPTRTNMPLPQEAVTAVPLTQSSLQPSILPADAPIQARSFQISGRTSQEAHLQTIPRPERGDSVITVTRGFRIRIGGAEARMSDGTMMDLGSVTLEADSAVIWTRDLAALIQNGIESEPLEIYLEGHIVFQQGQRVIYADRMYYNAQSEYGMVLSAEVLTPVPQYEGLLRLKADVVQQKSRTNFLAYDAALTSSRLGVPRYWLQSSKVEFSDQRNQTIDPATGQLTPIATPGGTDMEADARNNFVYLGGVPVLYWPILSTNIERPSFYLDSIKVKNDQIFGTQVMLDWDLYQLLGINGWNGTDWTLSTDYLSKRGFAAGTNFRYDLPAGLLPGPTAGYFDYWGIQDKGLDFLGSDRTSLTPEREYRGRGLFRHRQYLSQDLEFMAEVGWISDRNFLEQYFEREWDQEKDMSTALRLRRYADNRMLDIWGQARINKFHTETEWLPRLDHYWLGQSILERATWYAHSNVGYAHQRIASTPVDPADAAKFTLQQGEVDAEGIRAATRQEIDVPFNLGAVRVVPYLSGEAAHWGEDVTGNDLTRLTGQAGIRTSLPMWSVNPNVESRLLNLKGLAHKVTFQSDILYADSDKDISLLPSYDPIDDNAQEHFRRRLVTNTFAGLLPDQFDARGHALRQGMQRYVTSSSTEIMDDALQARLGINQRWQTKRGRPGRERIADVVEFDTGLVVFPKADRDNFGKEVGGMQYDFRYHIGDRVTLLSDGYFDIFDNGMKMVSVGTMFSRPGRGEIYSGLTSIEGPIHTLVATTTINYRLTEKWITTAGTAFDLGEVGNVGQSISMTRIGESFLFRLGASVDSGRDNVSFQFNLEPRFLSSRRLGAVGGQLIPPAGLYGLE